jgi:hypothetical protein
MFPDPSQAARPALMVSDSDVKQGGPKPKRRWIRRLWYVALVALVMLLIAAGGAFDICTGGSISSEVTFRFMSLRDYTAPPLDVYACVESSCTLVTIEGWQRNSVSFRTQDGHSVIDVSRWGVTVREPMLTSSEPLIVGLNVTDQTGEPVFDSTAIVEPRKLQPNGTFCAPTVYVATVVATSDASLVQQPEPSD